MARLDLGRALREARSAPESIPDIILRIAKPLGATDVVVYLVDFEQTTLEPLPERAAHAALPEQERVVGSMAGRAFIDGCCTVADRPDGARVWAPIVEGSDRTGVLAMTVPEATDATLAACEELGLLAGYLIATQARTTDLYNLHRRRRALSLAASMQWDLLPPLVLKTPSVAVAGLLEPAYSVPGDCFDYAVNDRVLSVGVMDAMGHGVGSALMSALAIGARTPRRSRRPARLRPTGAGRDRPPNRASDPRVPVRPARRRRDPGARPLVGRRDATGSLTRTAKTNATRVAVCRSRP